jgi:LPS-assembly lipoprotein
MLRLFPRHIVLWLLCAVLLSGCAYRPLYGTSTANGDVAAVLKSITVVEQSTRVGQILRNELISSFGGANGGGTLLLNLKVGESRVGVSSLGTVTRQRYRVSAGYILSDASGGKELTRGSSISAVSFDMVLEPVADLQSAEAARSRAAREVAQDIKLRLAAFLAAGR